VEREFRPELAPPDPPFEVPAASPAAVAVEAAPGTAPPVAPPSPAAPASGVDVYFYQRTTRGAEFDYLIYAVAAPEGGFEAVPVSPRDQRWADAPDRRSGATAREAVDALVREVLDAKLPDEIFPEIQVSY
jgi:hypothetical protein